ncbi:MAG: UV DNA damage repair endonuclease UvsE [Chlamydiales bacterium]
MIRFGLCCQFVRAPIKFRTTTVAYLKKLKETKNEFLSTILLDNSKALEMAIVHCSELGIGSFRISSRIFPAYTHGEEGYRLADLPASERIVNQLKTCKRVAKTHDIRLTFHPDQFVVLSTPNEEVLEKSLSEIEYHNLVADMVGADVITIHAGGVYGDKKKALKRFEKAFKQLSSSAQKKLALENDDRSYTPCDLLPLCHILHIPLVYDVHHHRCLPDALSEVEATREALKTWNREPLFHLSSPHKGWKGPQPFRHHEYIDINDFPKNWMKIDPLTVEIEAKGKELAILKLKTHLTQKMPEWAGCRGQSTAHRSSPN